MSFPRIRDPGLWLFDTVVEQEEFETFDEYLSNAIDGLNGGAYGLLDELEFGGVGGFRVSTTTNFDAYTQFNDSTAFIDDVTFSDAVIFLDDVGISGDVSVNGGLNVAGTTGFDGYTQFNDSVGFVQDVTFSDVAIFGDDVLVSGDLSVNGTSEFTGAGHFLAGLTVDGDFAADGDVALGNASTDVVTVYGKQVFSGNARQIEKAVEGADADTTYNPRAVQVVTVVLVTDDRTYTIDDTGCEDGDVIEFSTLDSTNTVAIKSPSGATLASIRNFGIDYLVSAKCRRVSGVWRRGPASRGF